MNYVSGKQKTWIKCLHLGDFFYNTTFHMSIGMSPFKSLYGYDASTFIEHITLEVHLGTHVFCILVCVGVHSINNIKKCKEILDS